MVRCSSGGVYGRGAIGKYDATDALKTISGYMQRPALVLLRIYDGAQTLVRESITIRLRIALLFIFEQYYAKVHIPCYSTC
jgi:hypothetical protein